MIAHQIRLFKSPVIGPVLLYYLVLCRHSAGEGIKMPSLDVQRYLSVPDNVKVYRRDAERADSDIIVAGIAQITSMIYLYAPFWFDGILDFQANDSISH